MERELIKGIKKKDSTSFEKLYNMYASYALRTAYIITKSRSMAADVVQETFVKVYQSIDGFDDSRPFKPYLYRILVNECYRIMKKNSKTLYLEDFPVYREEEKYYEDFDKERYELLYKGIRMLNHKIRIPMVLKYLRGFKEKEIAEILDINLNTLKSRLFKGRQKLREFLVENGEGGSFDEYQS